MHVRRPPDPASYTSRRHAGVRRHHAGMRRPHAGCGRCSAPVTPRSMPPAATATTRSRSPSWSAHAAACGASMCRWERDPMRRGLCRGIALGGWAVPAAARAVVLLQPCAPPCNWPRPQQQSPPHAAQPQPNPCPAPVPAPALPRQDAALTSTAQRLEAALPPGAAPELHLVQACHSRLQARSARLARMRWRAPAGVRAWPRMLSLPCPQAHVRARARVAPSPASPTACQSVPAATQRSAVFAGTGARGKRPAGASAPRLTARPPHRSWSAAARRASSRSTWATCPVATRPWSQRRPPRWLRSRLRSRWGRVCGCALGGGVWLRAGRATRRKAQRSAVGRRIAV